MFRKKKAPENLDVDARFLLANERTLLAWLRTGLTLIAGGIAVAFLYTSSALLAMAGLGAILLGGALALIGYKRYVEADFAIRSGELPKTGKETVVVVIGVIVFALALVVAKILGLK